MRYFDCSTVNADFQLLRAADLQHIRASVKQQRYLVQLITRSGKTAYLAASQRLNISEQTTLEKLTRAEAAALISELKRLSETER